MPETNPIKHLAQRSAGALKQYVRKTVKYLQRELGAPGDRIYSGKIYGNDFNPEFDGTWNLKERCGIFDKMLQSDTQIYATFLSVELPIVQAKWTIEPGTDDKPDREIAEQTERYFKSMTYTFEEFLRESLLHLVYGVAPFEKVLRRDEELNNEKWRWKKFGLRHPSTIERWLTGDNYELEGFRQRYYKPNGGYAEQDLEIDKLLVFINRRVAANYEGSSILRQAYKPFCFKDEFLSYMGMDVEKYASRTPIGRATIPGIAKKQLQELDKVLAGLVAGERGHITLPYGVEVGPMTTGNSMLDDILRAMALFDDWIARSVLAPFLNFGSSASGSSGNRSLGQSSTKFFMLAEKAIGNHVASTINRHAIKQLVDYNYSGVKHYPRLKLSNPLEDISYDKILEALPKFSAAGLVDPNMNVLETVHKIFNLDPPEKIPDPIGKKNGKQLSVTPIPPVEISLKSGSDDDIIEGEIVKTYKDGKYWRALRRSETFAALGEIEDRLDTTEENLYNEILPTREKAVASFLKKVKSIKDYKKDYYKVLDFQIPYKKEFISTAIKRLKKLGNFARLQLIAELDRQSEGRQLDESKATPDPWAGLAQLSGWLRLRLEFYFDDESTKLRGVVRNIILDGIRTEATHTEIFDLVKEEIKDGVFMSSAVSLRFLISETYNYSREIEADKHLKHIGAVEYSAILDGGVCSNCKPLDGRRFKPKSKDYYRFRPPNKYCLSKRSHTNRCRCMYFHIHNDELKVEERIRRETKARKQKQKPLPKMEMV